MKYIVIGTEIEIETDIETDIETKETVTGVEIGIVRGEVQLLSLYRNPPSC